MSNFLILETSKGINMSDALIGELNTNNSVIQSAVNDPFKIAGDFTSFYEDESKI